MPFTSIVLLETDAGVSSFWFTFFSWLLALFDSCGPVVGVVSVQAVNSKIRDSSIVNATNTMRNHVLNLRCNSFTLETYRNRK